MKANQAGVIIMMVASVALAFVMPTNIIARATAMFMGLCAAAFLPAFAAGIYAKNPSTKAALWSMISGSICWFLWTAFIHAAESKPLGLCQFIFGKSALLPLPWTVIDPIIIALPFSAAIMILMQWQSGSKNRSVSPSISE
jgi:SSS family solute:Na+ symporter